MVWVWQECPEYRQVMNEASRETLDLREVHQKDVKSCTSAAKQQVVGVRVPNAEQVLSSL